MCVTKIIDQNRKDILSFIINTVLVVMSKHRKLLIVASAGAALFTWSSIVQGYHVPIDVVMFALVGSALAMGISFMPRFVSWAAIGAFLPTAFLPIYLPAGADWIELESLHAFSFCIIGGVVGSLFGITARKEARWYQLSLRTFLLLVTLVALGFSPIGRAVVSGRIQQRAVRELSAKGASIRYSARRHSPLLQLVFGQHALQPVVSVVWHGNVPIRIGNTATYLGGGSIADADVEILLALPEMESLDLAGSRITDKGLRVVTNLSKLRHLDLRGISASDEAIASLQTLAKLQTLDLRGASVNLDVIEKLRVAMPDCDIQF